MNYRHRWLTVAALALALASSATSRAFGQGLTGQISGTVVDNTKAVLPGATVTVKNSATQVTREAVSDGTGAFVVTNLLAGTYDILVTLNSFKTFEQKGVVLTATERLALPLISLELGGLEETVSVQAEAAAIQTRSGERSAVITTEDLADRGLKGRDPFGTLNVLPGIVDTRNRDAPAAGSVGGLTINGQTSINFSYDGVTSKDTGSNSGNFAAPALDSIAQIKVQSSNFQAEYGRSSGATIVVVTKSGSRNFRGSVAYFRRDEAFNSNSWDRRRQCDAGQTSSCSKPPYDYNNTTYTIGGPVIMPGLDFNKNRDKLFFFWSQDLLPKTNPNQLMQMSMPTALERNGDFSQTVDTQGRRIWIRDPATNLACNVVTGAGGGCFANNIIPAERLNSIGKSILNLLPMPNAVDPTGGRQFNYTYQNVFEQPRNDQVLRVDWNVSPGTTFYSRLQFGHEVVQRGYSVSLGSSGNGGWPQFHTSRENNTVGLVNTLLHTFTPTTVMEITFGTNWAKQSTLMINPDGGLDSLGSLALNDRTKVLPGLTQFFPDANPLHLIPNMTFAGTNALPNMPNFQFENRFPFTARDDIYNVSANLTKLAGSHNLKAGIFVEMTRRPASRASSFNGTVSFNSAAANTFDTNFGYANALLGSVNQYTESTAHPYAQGRYHQSEFFIQDNWRVTRNFTLDYGSRFYYIGPTFVAKQQIATFVPNTYNPATAALLYDYVCSNGATTCSGTTRVARDPRNGQLLNATYIGKLVPGTGSFTPGMVVADQTPYKGVFRPAPRVGFAWDVTGDGRTAIRGGVGVFYDRYSDDTVLRLIEPSPLVDTRTTNFTTLTQLLSSPLVASTVSGARGFVDPFKPPTVYNWSVGVQRELFWKMTGDLAYVGNAGRNNSTSIPLNDFGYGTTRVDLNPQNADPTKNNTQAKDTDYLRPYRGLAGVTAQTWTGYNNYHSIQFSLNRRLSSGFAWGLSYTGSIRREMGSPDTFLPAAQSTARNYTRNGSRPHNLVVNYNYVVPGLSKVWNNMFARGIGDGWQITGVSTFQSGTRGGFSYAFTGAPFTDMTGGPGGSRVSLVCDPNLPRGERTFDRQFRTECVKAPGPLTDPADIYYLGNALNDEYVGLGYSNHDISVFKNFAMANRRTLQIRIELYNAFDTLQYGSVDTSAQFDFATGNQTDPNFGRVTASRGNSSRVIQLGVRFVF